MTAPLTRSGIAESTSPNWMYLNLVKYSGETVKLI